MTYKFNHRVRTQLCKIMGRYGSDKGSIHITSSWHNYTTFYHSIFAKMRSKKIRVFELGLGTNNVNLPSNMGADGKPGASLYGWSEYFPNAMVYGADIDKDILFNTDKIRTYYCDQTNSEVIKQMWNEPDLQENFDIIVEDGLHTYDANVCFFENSIHKLKPNGYFIIEDIANHDIHRFISKIKEWENTYTDCKFTLLQIPSVRNTYDNNLIVVHKAK
jgi:SAM-dependent methyltransferase